MYRSVINLKPLIVRGKLYKLNLAFIWSSDVYTLIIRLGAEASTVQSIYSIAKLRQAETSKLATQHTRRAHAPRKKSKR